MYQKAVVAKTVRSAPPSGDTGSTSRPCMVNRYQHKPAISSIATPAATRPASGPTKVAMVTSSRDSAAIASTSAPSSHAGRLRNWPAMIWLTIWA